MTEPTRKESLQVPQLTAEQESRILKDWVTQYGTGDLPQSVLSEKLIRCTLTELKAHLATELAIQRQELETKVVKMKNYHGLSPKQKGVKKYDLEMNGFIEGYNQALDDVLALLKKG